MFPLFVSAKMMPTLSGAMVIVPETSKWAEKIFILPSGLAYKEIIPIQNLKYLAQNLIPIAKAQSLTLKDEIELWIKSFASQYEVSETEMVKLARCESNFNVNAHNPKDPHGGANGLYQYLKPTFEAFKKEAKMLDLEYKSWQDQIQLTAWAFANKKYPKHWINCASFIKFNTWDKNDWK